MSGFTVPVDTILRLRPSAVTDQQLLFLYGTYVGHVPKGFRVSPALACDLVTAANKASLGSGAMPIMLRDSLSRPGWLRVHVFGVPLGLIVDVAAVCGPDGAPLHKERLLRTAALLAVLALNGPGAVHQLAAAMGWSLEP